MVSLLKGLALRLGLVVFGVALCSFFALDQPVLRSVYLATAHFLTLLTHLDTVVPSVLPFVWAAYWRSMLLLLGATVLGALAGVPLGFLSATRPHALVGWLAGLLSYLGTLTPSFILGLLVMVFFVRYLGAWTGIQWIRILPSPGFPDPREIIAPTLTLAARPVAFVARVTAAHVRAELWAAYVTTAQSKGLRRGRIVREHVWPNVAAPALGALRSSLLFSLSSLPVVEYIFGWRGVGYTLFQAVLRHQAVLAAALLAALGVTFVLLTTLADLIDLRLDPRAQLARGDG
jgi:ABC-type dipeptide/oligopeptide/nickel transport system permease component